WGVNKGRGRDLSGGSFVIAGGVGVNKILPNQESTGRAKRAAPLSPPLVQRPHPPFLVSAQSEESLRWAAQYDIPFAQIDSMVEQAKRDQALYREVQTAHGHPPTARLYLMREIYVADTDTRASAEARPYLPQYWELWNRYTQFTQDGKLPDSYDFWRRQAPMLHAMSFDQIVANDMVILGGGSCSSWSEPILDAASTPLLA